MSAQISSLPSKTPALSGVAAHLQQCDSLGAHAAAKGTSFAVWAPNASQVEVMGSFSQWHPLAMERLQDCSGRWVTTVASACHGDFYKYGIHAANEHCVDKADPYATRAELAPGTPSQIWSLDYTWSDSEWMNSRAQRQSLNSPVSVYEVHLGSWQRHKDGRFLNYREISHRLGAHCEAMGFPHVELMPVSEHPFYGSWGYQTTGYFAPTARYGEPQDLMDLVDTLHQHGIGVMVDWVASHFPSDTHGLAHFDGTALYEHEDPRQGFHPEWNSLIFNYGRFEVRDFLIGNALFWLEKYHFDAIRVDAVSSMLYLDFSRKPGERIPNQDGGNQNWDAVRFLQDLNAAVYAAFPDVQVIAEESTSWAGVSTPVHDGGLGFGMKWNMGWMNDTLRYMQRPHIQRSWQGDDIRLSSVYAFDENFVPALSHDEVVYGKHSLLMRQPGDDWQRFAGVRPLYGMMWFHLGKKLLFMGGEFGQVEEWHHERTLDWHQWSQTRHAGIAKWVADLNHLYRAFTALYASDFGRDGFRWANLSKPDATVLAFFRQSGEEVVLAVHNLTPRPFHDQQVQVPCAGHWHELLNSDAACYGGSGMGNAGGVDAVPLSHDSWTVTLTVPPLSTLFLSNRPARV